MPSLPILRLGHPALRTPAQPLPLARLADPAVQQLIDDMIVTMREASGIGLAAPQVGAGIRVLVYERPAAAREKGPVAVVNPELVPLPGELVHDWEGCLSIPGLLGRVPRHPAVRVRGFDRDGRPLDLVITGPEARVAQHEADHLDGILFLDRMEDFKTLRFEDGS